MLDECTGAWLQLTFLQLCFHSSAGSTCLECTGIGITLPVSTWSWLALTQPSGWQVAVGKLDNRELDKLVGALGRSRATWRRALLLHEWLLGLGHAPDDRLCTTLIRVCAQHGQVRRCSRCCDLVAPALLLRLASACCFKCQGLGLLWVTLCELSRPQKAHWYVCLTCEGACSLSCAVVGT